MRRGLPAVSAGDGQTGGGSIVWQVASVKDGSRPYCVARGLPRPGGDCLEEAGTRVVEDSRLAVAHSRPGRAGSDAGSTHRRGSRSGAGPRPRYDPEAARRSNRGL